MARIFLIHGFVGAGKTTFAKKLSAETGAIRFSPDDWIDVLYGKNPPADNFADYDQRVKNLIWELTITLTEKQQDVILDYGFWTRAGRNKYRQKAQNLNAEVVLYSIKCDCETMRERVRARTAMLPKGALYVDDNAFDLFLKKFEPLDDDEDREEIITN